MQTFESLPIWRDVGGRMSWYYQVSNNTMPAKYLICKRIRAPTVLAEASEEELWRMHAGLALQFYEIFHRIRSGSLRLGDMEAESPSFLDLKVELVRRMLRHCNFCRWNCRIDRSLGAKHGTCQLESVSRIGSYFHHRGEELPIRGTGGSGTIFFTSCNMRCQFCQNGDISHDKDNGLPVTPRLLALMAWQLRTEGCHNINLVGGEPTIHLHNIVEAISLLDIGKPNLEDLAYIGEVKADLFQTFRRNLESSYFRGEFNVPILWNSNFFMSPETMQLLRELVDIWLPDFKFGSDKCSIKLSRTPWYWDTVTRNHKMVYDWSENMVIRHLIMPNHVECCTKPVLEWIARNTPGALVNVMDQFHPDYACDPCSQAYDPLYKEISRFPTKEEIFRAYKYASELGLHFESITFEKAMRFGPQLLYV